MLYSSFSGFLYFSYSCLVSCLPVVVLFFTMRDNPKASCKQMHLSHVCSRCGRNFCFCLVVQLVSTFSPDSVSYWGSYFKCIGRAACVRFRTWVLVPLQGAAASCAWKLGCWCRRLRLLLLPPCKARCALEVPLQGAARGAAAICFWLVRLEVRPQKPVFSVLGLCWHNFLGGTEALHTLK